jgi:hypothetical protein
LASIEVWPLAGRPQRLGGDEIVIGLDVHKQSVTAVAVDEAGRPLGAKVIPVGCDELLGWASSLATERLWAVEDCRQLTRWLERQNCSAPAKTSCGCRRS